MRKHSRKATTVVLIALLTAALLAGCGSGGNSTATTAVAATTAASTTAAAADATAAAAAADAADAATDATTAAATTAATTTAAAAVDATTVAAATTQAETGQKPVTLNYWIIGPGKQKDSDEVWAEYNKEVQKYLPHVTVNISVIDGDVYKDNWARAMAAREQVDLAWTGWLINKQEEANKGSIMPLDDLLNEYGQHIKDRLGDDVIDMHRLSDGKLYQIITWQGLIGNRCGVYLPTEVAHVAGENFTQELQDIFIANWKTVTPEAKRQPYDKMETLLAALQANDMLAKGYMPDSMKGWWCMQTGMKGIDLAYVAIGDNDFKANFYFTSDIFKMTYERMADWYKKGYIRSDVASLETISETWTIDKTWQNSYINYVQNAFTDTTAQERSAAYGFPIEVALCNPYCEYILGDATGTSIPTTCSDPVSAMQLLDLLYSENGRVPYQLYSYGIEGKHWQDNGDGTITTLGGTGQPSSDWAYGNWNWTMGTCDYSLYPPGYQPGMYKQLREMEATAYVNPLIGFTFNAENVETERAQIDAIFPIYDDMLSRGYLGDDWEAMFDEFYAKMKESGVDAYMAELQRQLDAYVQEHNCKW